MHTMDHSALGKEIKEGISLITAVKNRSEKLEKILPNWLSFPEINEIIIVDWDSDNSIEPIIQKYQNEKIAPIFLRHLNHIRPLAA